MTSKSILIPGPNHPITIEPAAGRVRVVVAGVTIADSRNALVLREAAYPPVHYVPVEDVDMKWLAPSDHATYCPYKGDCSYYSIPVGGERSRNAVWTYLAPYEAVKAIAGHVAFYADRVDSLDVETSH